MPDVQVFVSMLPDGRPQQTSVYHFKEPGDEIPLHVHPHWHNCLVVSGSVEIYDDAGKSVTLHAGQLAGLNAGRKHAIKAVEAGTMTVHTNEPGK
jgi:quercetin dioxygenase-like cupin family protein